MRSSVTTATTEVTSVGRRHRRRHGVTAYHLLLDTAYLLLGLPVGIVTFTWVVTGWSTGLSMLVTLIGIPILMATIHVSRWLSWVERQRAALVLGAPIAQHYKQPKSRRLIDRVKAPFTDAASWKDLIWQLAMLPLGIAGFTIAVTCWSVSFYCLTLWTWWWAVPNNAAADFGGFEIHSWWGVALVFLVGVISAPLTIALVRGTAAGTANLARVILGRSTLEERVETLTETRAGAVDAAATELARIERDLHDGAQARLVALAMDLGMAEERFERDPDGARELMTKARDEAKLALVELRELARGIRPSMLAERGLAEAVRSLAARSPLPASVEVTAPDQLPVAVESAAYFVVAEALTNAAKHSRGCRATVRIRREGDLLVVEVTDDGQGGADPNGGGLSGLRKRVEALDGRLRVGSPTGGPTLVRGELPCVS